jgi:acyl phosphate:glycerol-3-phosphate acyltransferase
MIIERAAPVVALPAGTGYTATFRNHLFRKHRHIMNILLPIASYLIGAIPFGLLIGRLAGIDVRASGSGNIGATNVTRLAGKKFGVLTLLLDILKGFLPIYIASALLPQGSGREFLLLLCGVCAVVGHMFPVYLRFKGGKGVATGVGVLLFLSPVAVAITVAVFVATVALTGFVSAGSLLGAGLSPLWLWLLGESTGAIAAGVIIALLIWIKHHENIGRLVRGEEKTWKKK